MSKVLYLMLASDQQQIADDLDVPLFSVTRLLEGGVYPDDVREMAEVLGEFPQISSQTLVEAYRTYNRDIHRIWLTVRYVESQQAYRSLDEMLRDELVYPSIEVYLDTPCVPDCYAEK